MDYPYNLHINDRLHVVDRGLDFTELVQEYMGPDARRLAEEYVALAEENEGRMEEIADLEDELDDLEDERADLRAQLADLRAQLRELGEG